MVTAWRARRAQGAAREYALSRSAASGTAWRDAHYCVVDLELSGLDPRRHEIISFGAIPIDEGRVRLAGAVHGLVRPQRPLAEDAIRVHGIRAADLAGAPSLAEALEVLLAAMAGRVVGDQHAAVERAFLIPALRSVGVRLRGPVIDTAVLGRLWLAERDGVVPRRMSLAELTAAIGLPAHSPHTAIGDALTTAQLFIAAATHLDALRPETVRRLASAGTALANLRVYQLSGHVETARANPAP